MPQCSEILVSIVYRPVTVYQRNKRHHHHHHHSRRRVCDGSVCSTNTYSMLTTVHMYYWWETKHTQILGIDLLVIVIILFCYSVSLWLLTVNNIKLFLILQCLHIQGEKRKLDCVEDRLWFFFSISISITFNLDTYVFSTVYRDELIMNRQTFP